jgi:transcription initiation factor TFIIIB Brf1 subunit/transcription initiation factor TFIIB
MSSIFQKSCRERLSQYLRRLLLTGRNLGSAAAAVYLAACLAGEDLIWGMAAKAAG